MSERVTVIGFEGPHRVGKGEQIERLGRHLDSRGVMNLTLRGDGSRTGEGISYTDTKSDWWIDINKRLRTPERKLEDWNVTSNRLARELVVWRDRLMPNLLDRIGRYEGVLLVDRSLLSRTLIPREQGLDPKEALYVPLGKGRVIIPDDVCPDIIFDLTAPKETLMARLDPSDPKYDFRKRLIEQRYDWYVDAKNHIPEHLQSRVITVDSSRPIEEVSYDIITHTENLLYGQ